MAKIVKFLLFPKATKNKHPKTQKEEIQNSFGKNASNLT